MAHCHLNQILQSYHEEHLSHAFLIETNDQEQCLLDLQEILCQINCEQVYDPNCQNCSLCHLLKSNNLPSFIIIRPDGQNIKKNQVLEMKQKFSTKPIYSKYNMYVMMNAEKFNASSANTILKFLEEPEEGILGFFLTNNKENIIDTIRSRCQIISNFYDVTNQEDDVFLQIVIDYLKDVYLSCESLDCNRSLLQKEQLLKENYTILFQTILNIYYLFYQVTLQIKSLPEIYEPLRFLLKRNSSYFLKQLKLVEELEHELSYNVNINLLLDRFVLEARD